jgi:hypothetical protein
MAAIDAATPEQIRAVTPEAAPVATDAELRDLSSREVWTVDARRALYNLGREHGAAQARCPHIRSSDEGTSYCALAEQTAAAQPAPPAAPAPAGGLVERLGEVWNEGERLHPYARRAAIREVAAWLRAGRMLHAAELLEQEADRG